MNNVESLTMKREFLTNSSTQQMLLLVMILDEASYEICTETFN